MHEQGLGIAYLLGDGVCALVGAELVSGGGGVVGHVGVGGWGLCR